MYVSSFLSYLILFVILVSIVVCGAMLGVKSAKRKNAKMRAKYSSRRYNC